MKRLLLIIIVITISISLNAQKGRYMSNLREEINNARIAFFTTEIGLTPEEAKVFWPLYEKTESELYKLRQDGISTYKQLEKLLSTEEPDEVEIRKLVQKYNECRNLNSVIDIYLPEYYKILPATKVARFIIADEQFKIKMINLWKRGKKSELKNKSND